MTIIRSRQRGCGQSPKNASLRRYSEKRNSSATERSEDDVTRVPCSASVMRSRQPSAIHERPVSVTRGHLARWRCCSPTHRKETLRRVSQTKEPRCLSTSPFPMVMVSLSNFCARRTHPVSLPRYWRVHHSKVLSLGFQEPCWRDIGPSASNRSRPRRQGSPRPYPAFAAFASREAR